MSEGRLIVCATPIGNLDDVSIRLRETLTTVGLVLAEDTRRTAKLLAHLGAEPSVKSLFVGNEAARTDEMIAALAAGRDVALVSDAGMPTVSDPGAGAVRAAREAGFTVSVVPGPSAVTAAVAASGFGADRFVFEGFLPKKGRERSRRIEALASEERAAVIFASPHRIHQDLEDLRRSLGDDRRVAVAREMTKLHEEVWVGRLSEATERWSDRGRGEFTLVVEPGPPPSSDARQALDHARQLVTEGVSRSEAARRAATEAGVSRRAIYEILVADQELI